MHIPHTYKYTCIYRIHIRGNFLWVWGLGIGGWVVGVFILVMNTNWFPNIKSFLQQFYCHAKCHEIIQFGSIEVYSIKVICNIIRYYRMQKRTFIDLLLCSLLGIIEPRACMPTFTLES